VAIVAFFRAAGWIVGARVEAFAEEVGLGSAVFPFEPALQAIRELQGIGQLADGFAVVGIAFLVGLDQVGNGLERDAVVARGHAGRLQEGRIDHGRALGIGGGHRGHLTGEDVDLEQVADGGIRAGHRGRADLCGGQVGLAGTQAGLERGQFGQGRDVDDLVAAIGQCHRTQHRVAQVGHAHAGFIGIVVGQAGGVVADGQQDQALVAGLVQHQRVTAIDDRDRLADHPAFSVIGGDGGIVEWTEGRSTGQRCGNASATAATSTGRGSTAATAASAATPCRCQQAQAAGNYRPGDAALAAADIGRGIGHILYRQRRAAPLAAGELARSDVATARVPAATAAGSVVAGQRFGGARLLGVGGGRGFLVGLVLVRFLILLVPGDLGFDHTLDAIARDLLGGDGHGSIGRDLDVVELLEHVTQGDIAVGELQHQLR
jgi:hypothetical protein